MYIFPSVDIYEGKVVRLYKGDYGKVTVFGSDPFDAASDFRKCGAGFIHIVDLGGARDGKRYADASVIKRIKEELGLYCQIGGGIRDMETVDLYLSELGIDRVILGTAAVNNPELLYKACRKYPGRIAAGADLKDGFIAVKGWTEKTGTDIYSFTSMLEDAGVDTVICTDISRDGAMKGTNLELYRNLSEKTGLNIIASGGVSSLEDIRALRDMGLYGAIIGKAYYTGAINLKEAIEEAV